MKALEAFLAGRIWPRGSIPFPKEAVDKALEQGQAQIVQGVNEQGECNRCLEKSAARVVVYPCASCTGTCRYCRTCIKMGRISSCTELILWKETPPQKPQSKLFGWQGKLTPLQERASQAVSRSIENGEGHLLHAVCGAGKTEILFAPIHAALEKGLRIAIAAPRTDVVLELAPRIHQAFPDTVVHVLYGNSPEQNGYGELVLATTHQLYRFHEAFDVLFVDEADAFPYSFDPSLERAVKKAAKPNAPIIYISATPSSALQRSIPTHSTIFRRYHGHPLPVPRYQALWNYEKKLRKRQVPGPLEKWIADRLKDGKPFLLFFPSIELIDQAAPLLQAIDPLIQTVHAKDPDRKEKVLGLRDGKLRGLATSTILERGITIRNLQVAVVGADHRVFDSAALIQIAGRTGRSADSPTGDVVFFHNGISYQMDEARRSIRSFNKEGY